MKALVILGLGVGALVLGLLPTVIPSYYVGLMIKVFIFAIFAMSLDLLMGYTGLPSLGHAAFLGVAAYGVGIASLRISNQFVFTLGIGLGIALVTSAIIGLMVLRARGPQFLMLTLALSQVLWGIAFNWKSVTGGDDGLPRIPRPDLGLGWNLADPTVFYYFAFTFFLVAAVLMFLIIRSPFGHTLEGIRESETRMSSLGYNVWLHQYMAFLIAGLFSGLSGVLFAYYNGFVSPIEFHVSTSAKGLLMVVLGGAGTLFGPVLGAGIVVILENVVSGYTQRWLTIMGALYVLAVIFAPSGVYVPLRNYLRRWISL